MSNVLPIIKMPAKEPEPAPEPMLENPDGDKDLIDKIEQSIGSSIQSDEEDIINIEPRNIPDEEDVFTNPPSIKPIVQPIVQDEPEPPTEFQPKGKRKYVRKAPMSEKQKAHLERIRKIAAEKKRIKREEKEEQKAQDKLLLQQKKQEEQEKKEEQKRLKEEKKIQEEVNKRLYKPEPEQSQKSQGVTPQNFFTKEDMENAMLSAITSYDAVRKKQKQEKKERLAKEAQEAQMRRTLENAIRPPQVQNDPWRSYFT